MKTKPPKTWSKQRQHSVPPYGAFRRRLQVMHVAAQEVFVDLSAIVAGLAVLTFGACPAQAAFTYSKSFDGLSLIVPDGSVVGASDTRHVSSGLVGTLVDVCVSIELSGGFTGDIYALLIHDGVSTVLLNRTGRREGDELGYEDAGFNITFSDNAWNGDVHNYRLTLSGSHDTPLGGPLTGEWQPDGRMVNPASVVDTDLRSGFLSSLVGHTPDGEWTLFLADLSPVGESTLNSWKLELVLAPEPSSTAAQVALGLLGWGFCRRRRN